MKSGETIKKSGIRAKKKPSPLVYGIIGSAGLLIVYFGLLTLLNSFGHAIDQFFGMWYWILALSIGFGAQVALYAKIRNSCITSGAAMPAEIAATGGISGASMVACCAHHITDLAPLLGLSAAAIFLTKYQALFIILGVLSNINGIMFMLATMQKHDVSGNEQFFKRIYMYNLSDAFKAVFAASLLAFIAMAIFY